jgi:hypothetical protein
MEHWWNDTDRRKAKYWREKLAPLPVGLAWN